MDIPGIPEPLRNFRRCCIKVLRTPPVLLSPPSVRVSKRGDPVSASRIEVRAALVRQTIFLSDGAHQLRSYPRSGVPGVKNSSFDISQCRSWGHLLKVVAQFVKNAGLGVGLKIFLPGDEPRNKNRLQVASTVWGFKSRQPVGAVPQACVKDAEIRVPR